MMQRTTDSRSQNSNKLPAISFRHLCHLERPTSWPVSQLYGEIMSSGSALQALYNAPVTDITVCQCYTRQGNTMHQYIILCICSPDPNMLSGLGRVWARCERNAGAEPHSGTARDTITFSIERPKLRANGDKALMECTYDSLKVEHIADLLKIVHDIAPRYEKTSHNEWWFVAIAVGALQSLRTDWTIKPPKEWSSKAVEVLSKANTRARSQEIARLFDSHWHPSSVAPVPVYSYQAWGVAAERPLPVVPAKAPTPAVEPEPTIEEPPEQQTLSVSSDTPSTSPSPSWSSTNLAFGDAISSVRRIFEESHYLDMAKTYSEPDLVMDLLQDALDDPSERLGTLRTPALRLLQDISWASDQLPRRVKLPPVRNRVFWDSGGEAVIWTGQLSGKKVIVRDARPPDGKDWTSPGGKLVLKLVRRQVVAHLQIHHPNVLPLLGTTTDTGHPLSVITPFAENGHALRYLNNMDRGERPATFLRISANIASALYYLHTREPPIIHGDVHARNIVIDESGTPLLCDFGLSRIQHEQTRTFTSIIEGGKYRYLAPELFSYSPDDATFPKFRTTSATDCYAFAMAMLEMATLKRPFVEFENEMSASRAAERGIRPRRCGEDMMGDLSSDAVDLVWALLGRMWAHDPKARPGLDAVEARLEEISASIGAGNPDQ